MRVTDAARLCIFLHAAAGLQGISVADERGLIKTELSNAHLNRAQLNRANQHDHIAVEVGSRSLSKQAVAQEDQASHDPTKCEQKLLGTPNMKDPTCCGILQGGPETFEGRCSDGYVLKATDQECTKLGCQLTKCYSFKCKPPPPPPVACEWDAWTPFRECTATCGIGDQKRIRSIKIEARHGGDECDGPDAETKTCSDQECTSTTVKKEAAEEAAESPVTAEAAPAAEEKKGLLGGLPKPVLIGIVAVVIILGGVGSFMIQQSMDRKKKAKLYGSGEGGEDWDDGGLVVDEEQDYSGQF